MAKDYFQDIVPPPGEPNFEGFRHIPIHTEDEMPVRGIRSIQAPVRTRPIPRMSPAQLEHVGAMRERHAQYADSPPRRFSRWWIWAAAVLALLVVGVLTLLAFRPSTVTVIPKSRQITLAATVYVAHSAVTNSSADSAALLYTVQSSDFEDSEVVPSQGTIQVANKASGSITAYNEYSASSVRLIKGTRFETPSGLIFRVPADIVIPGKKGTVPGQVTVSIIADQAGEKYNIGPVGPGTRFTLPGLKSGDMYSKVYAKSSASTAGGFVGEQQGTAPGALSAAIATVRARLEVKARESAAVQASSADSFAFPELMRITFESLPNTTEAGLGVRIHERARVQIPLFPRDAFSAMVARSVAEDADTGAVALFQGTGFSARMATSSDAVAYGVDPIVFTLKGEALLVWKVDEEALAAALAGRDSEAFETIIKGFSGVKEARARIQPFWNKKTFPTSPASIKINVQAVNPK